MWIKRTKEEVKSERFRQKGNGAIFWFTVVFFVVSISIKLGWNKASASLSPISWEDFFSRLPGAFIIATLMALLAFFGPPGILDWTPGIGSMVPDALICDRCGKIKMKDRIVECPCGGRWVDFIEMKWVEEDKR
jgi:hypothetical protein